MKSPSDFFAIAIVVICVLAPLVLFGFILRAALSPKPKKGNEKKEGP